MKHESIRLWDEGEYKGAMDDGFVPVLESYILDGDRRRAAVVICPGGGYEYRSPREAEPIALKFNAAGFHAFILHYSVSPRRHPLPLLDLSRAVCLVRERAGIWNVRSDGIVVCGFSAGAHLAASLGVHWNKAFALEAAGIRAEANRPDALVLCYPVITSGEFAHRGSFDHLLGVRPGLDLLREVSLENHVDDRVPPTFLWHTFADSAVPVENSLLFAMALRKKGIPFELHVYPDGEHGLALANEETGAGRFAPDPHVASWIGLCAEWIGSALP